MAEPRAELYKIVLERINSEKIRLAKARLVYGSIIGVASVFALVPTWQYFLSEFTQSGFYQYLSLILSDGITSAYWKELGLTLAESLPVLSITATLCLVFVLLLTLKYLVRDTQVVFIKNQLA